MSKSTRISSFTRTVPPATLTGLIPNSVCLMRELPMKWPFFSRASTVMGGGVGRARLNRRRDLMIVSEGGKDARLEDPDSHRRLRGVDGALLGCGACGKDDERSGPEPGLYMHRNTPVAGLGGALRPA